MGGEILRLPSGYIDAVDVRVGEGRIDATGVDGLVVATPGHHLPGVARLLFMGQSPDLAGAPVKQRNIILRAILLLIVEGNGAAIFGPARILFANCRRVSQFDDFATLTGYSVQIPEFIASVVLLVDDPF